jgi:hypothetical protein
MQRWRIILRFLRLFNKFFCEQSTLDDSDHTPPDLTELQTDGLRQILITETEVEDILKILDTSKATGPDINTIHEFCEKPHRY